MTQDAPMTDQFALAYAAAIKDAADLIHRVADGYDAAGDRAIATGLYLTEGNVRSITPKGLADALAAMIVPLEWTPNTDYRVDGLIAGDYSGFWTTHKSDDFQTWEWADPFGKTSFGFESQPLAIAALEAQRTSRILAAFGLEVGG